MKRVRVRYTEVLESLQSVSPAEVAEKAGRGPKVTVKNGGLSMRWKSDQKAEAVDSARMSPEQILKTHILPRLHATKTVTIRRPGQPTERYRYPDHDVQLTALRVVFQLKGLIK